METYGLSVQVKTCEKPQDRTSASASLRDFGLVGILLRDFLSRQKRGWLGSQVC